MMADSGGNALATALQEQLSAAHQELAKAHAYTQVLENSMKQQLAKQLERNGMLESELTSLKTAMRDVPRIGTPLRNTMVVNASPAAAGKPRPASPLSGMGPLRTSNSHHRRSSSHADSPLSQVLRAKNSVAVAGTAVGHDQAKDEAGAAQASGASPERDHNAGAQSTASSDDLVIQADRADTSELQAEVVRLRNALAQADNEKAKLKSDLLEYQRMVERQDDVLQVYSTRVTRLQSKADSGLDLTAQLRGSKRPSAVNVVLPTQEQAQPDEGEAPRRRTSAPACVFRCHVSLQDVELATASWDKVVLAVTLVPGMGSLPEAWQVTRKPEAIASRRLSLTLAQLQQLRTDLVAQYPHCVAPPLLVTTDGGSVMQDHGRVAFACEQFISTVLQHPILSCTPQVVKLLTGKATKVAKGRCNALEINRDVGLFEDHPMGLDPLSETAVCSWRDNPQLLISVPVPLAYPLAAWLVQLVGLFSHALHKLVSSLHLRLRPQTVLDRCPRAFFSCDLYSCSALQRIFSSHSACIIYLLAFESITLRSQTVLDRCRSALEGLQQQQQQAGQEHHQVSAALMLLQQQPWLSRSHDMAATLSHIHSTMAAVAREQQEDTAFLSHWLTILARHLSGACKTPTNHAELELVVSQINMSLVDVLRAHAERLAESQQQLQTCATLASTATSC
eukprot:TRINITY_DN9296_c0_g2_i7.p1 TRINITY_DN9296_c0_g2~~TRINITY_DN9296_c0_g2_i7.p1  ORF type:complete len:678 (+),score=176.19 TRINITY_DN9296_c0_g2_i7:464-2497(+)